MDVAPSPDPRPPARATRRAVLSHAAAGACAIGALVLAGCAQRVAATPPATAPAGSPQPEPAGTRTKIVFYAKPPNANANPRTIIRIMQEVLAPYYAAHKGVFVELIPEELPTAQIVAGILAGQQMDIIYDNYFAPYYQQGLVVPLRPYFERDSVDPAVWNPAQYALYNTPKGPMAVPTYTGTSVLAVNQGMFDRAGLTYPNPDWTYQEFAAISRQLAHPLGKRPVYGSTVFWWTSGPSQQASWVFKAFGGNQVSPTGAPSQLAAAPNLAALDWLYHELFWPKVGVPLNVAGSGQFLQNQLALMDMDTWSLLGFAQTINGGVKFDFVPYPRFPAGRTTFCTADFYAIAANCKHVDAAWELLRWVSVEPTWQRATFSYALRSPALNSLWPEWAATVQQVVPFFKGKAFEWFGDAASKGYAYPVEYYPYSDQRVWQVLPTYFQRLYARQLTVAGAAATIDHVVNGLEGSAQAMAAAQGGIAKEFPVRGGSPIAQVQPGL